MKELDSVYRQKYFLIIGIFSINILEAKFSSSSFSGTYPKMINHIAVSVPDLDQAVKWYKEVLGFTEIKEPLEFVADDSLKGMAVKDIHGPRLKKMRMVWLSSANQVGFEIFEYIEPKAERRMKITLNTGNQASFTFA